MTKTTVQNDATMFQPWQMGLYTAAAVKLLIDGKPGDFILLELMNQAVGRDCSSEGNGAGNVRTAIRHVHREKRILWMWQRDRKGWLCLDPGQTLSAAEGMMQYAHRRAKRGCQVISVVDAEQLTLDQKVRYQICKITTGTMALMSATGQRKRVSDYLALKDTQLQQPDPMRLLEAMRGPNGVKT